MRNIRLAYVLKGLYFSWFWMGVWVLFYLRFTNYAGIGLLETIMIVTRIVTEIPTGAIADLLGKKYTLIAAFALTVIGNIVMGIAVDFTTIVIAVLFLTAAGSLFSGTFEALVYDSLKAEKKEKTYDRVISHLFTIQLSAFGLCSIIGGYLYGIRPGLPFLAVGVVQLIGFVLAFFLQEPQIDTEKFSFHSFIHQNMQGFKQLTKTRSVRTETAYILSVSIFLIILYEVLNDILAVEYGFSAEQLGVLMAATYIVGAVSSQITAPLLQRYSPKRLITVLGLLIVITLVTSPFVTFLLGGITILLRSGPHQILENVSSIIVNKNTESKYRATTLSTFAMATSLPYAFFAIYVGTIMDTFSAKNVTGVIGLFVLCIVFIFTLFILPRNKHVA
jgi:MFS family permease